MATSTYHQNFLDLPNETILNILSHLDKPDLAEIRHVCKRLSSFSAKLLFKSIATSIAHIRSLLRLACHPELSNYVEELVFLEMGLSYIRKDVTWPLLERTELLWELVNLVRKHFGLHPDFDENTSTSDEDWDPSTYEVNQPFHYNVDEPQPQVFSEMFFDSWKPSTAARAMFLLLVDIIEHYKQLQKFSQSEEAYRMMKTSLGGLPNLKRIKICDAHQGGILKSCSYLAPSLIELQQYFPIDEAVIRTRFGQDGPGYVSGIALPNFLAAIAESKKPIDSLVVFPESGLFETGIRLDQVDNLEYHLQTDQGHWKDGLSHVRSLEIRLDICQGRSDEAERNKNKAQTSLLSQCLRLSTSNLESLSISFVQDVSISERQNVVNKDFFHVVPLDCVFTKLHSLNLRHFVFESEPALTNFLVQQPALRNLGLISCEVIGTWCGVIDLLKAAPSFILDTINIQHPRDTENHEHKTDDGRSNLSFLSSIARSERILDYINSKETLNMASPFAKLQRQWRVEDAAIWNVSADASGFLEDIDFEDASDWDYEERMHCGREWRRRQIEDADEEGPEFDSDYDFDAEEESDSDDEGVIWGKDEWIPTPRKLLGERKFEEASVSEDMEGYTRVRISVRKEPEQNYNIKPNFKVLLISTDFGDNLEYFHTSNENISPVLRDFVGNCGVFDVNCRRGTGTFTIAVIDSRGKKTLYDISAMKKLTLFALDSQNLSDVYTQEFEESIRRELNPGWTTDVIILGLPAVSKMPPGGSSLSVMTDKDIETQQMLQEDFRTLDRWEGGQITRPGEHPVFGRYTGSIDISEDFETMKTTRAPGRHTEPTIDTADQYDGEPGERLVFSHHSGHIEYTACNSGAMDTPVSSERSNPMTHPPEQYDSEHVPPLPTASEVFCDSPASRKWSKSAWNNQDEP